MNTNQASDAEQEPIDVKTLAVSMTASSGSYDNKLTAEQCAANLFDGDEINTFGDLKSGNTYTIDFGEGTTITPTKIAVYPRHGSASGKGDAEYVARLNGLQFLGSNDGATWTPITDAISGIAAKDADAVKWHELAVIAQGSYRYIQITGAEGGNIGEVKIYSTVNTDAATALSETPDTPETDENTDNSDATANTATDSGNIDAIVETAPSSDSSETTAETSPESETAETTPEAESSDAADEEPETGIPAENEQESSNDDADNASELTEPESDTTNSEVPVTQAPDADVPEAITVPEEENSDDNSDSLADAE